MQTLGALVAVVTVGWAMRRADALEEIGERRLYLWIRYVVPWALVSVGGWWVVTEVL